MPNASARYRQADLARAIRAMKSVFGNAEVVFETDGRVRILPTTSPTASAKEERDTWEDFDEIDLGPWIPHPIRDLTVSDLKALRAELPHRTEAWIRQQSKLQFHRRESDGLEQLKKRGVGVFVPLGELRYCGPDTVERLLVRGYVEIRRNESGAIWSAAIASEGVQSLEPPPRRMPRL